MRRFDWFFICAILVLMLLLAVQSRANGLVVSDEAYPGWTTRAEIANIWFNVLGHPSKHLVSPPKQVLENNLKGIRYLYVLGHGYYGSARERIAGYDVTPAMIYENAGELDFMFSASCDGACKAGEGTFTSITKELVGYCHMDSIPCTSCWYEHSLNWESAFFSGMRTQPIEEAFNAAMDKYPQCQGCIQYISSIAERPRAVSIQPILQFLL